MPSTLRNPARTIFSATAGSICKRLRERLGGLGQLLLEAQRGHFLFLLHVDFPAGQLLRQARVLAAATDGERKIFLIDQHGDLVRGFVDLEGLELGRLERLDHEFADVRPTT